MSKHTPGPWEYRPRRDKQYASLDTVTDSSGKEVALLSDQMTNNANLIAAAPELLEACKAALRQFDNSDTVNDALDNAVLCQIEEAILKAEGKA